MGMFPNLERVALNELKKMDSVYSGKDEFNTQDCEKFEALTHGLKCLLTACAMLEAGPYSNGMSGTMDRGGYSREPGYSGHMPMYPAYPERYRY